jgi:ATP-grasp domain
MALVTKMSNTKSRASTSPNLRILLADTNWWANSARLAIGLAETGCDVSAVCPTPNHALTKTHAVHRVYRYRALHPIESLLGAIEASDPEMVVPSCDRSVRHLHELYRWAQSKGNTQVSDLIERSLGAPTSHRVVSSRYDLLASAREEGIPVPETARVNGLPDLENWLERETFPWVLKADGTWGGGGVRVIRSADDARRSLKQLEQMSRFTRSVKRLVINRDAFWLREWWTRAERSIIAQAFVQGRPANCTVVCWQGRILAGIAVGVVKCDGATGPASVVRIVESKAMMQAAERLAARLQLSGFFGLDFMIEDEPEKVYLIEMNPRLAPPCHLRLGKGRDLAGALWAQLASQPLPSFPTVTDKKLIAYFPHGMNGDPAFLDQCFRDIPQGEPELSAELLNPFPDRTILFRIHDFMTKRAFAKSGAHAEVSPEEHADLDVRDGLPDSSGRTPINQPVGKAGARST